MWQTRTDSPATNYSLSGCRHRLASDDSEAPQQPPAKAAATVRSPWEPALGTPNSNLGDYAGSANSSLGDVYQCIKRLTRSFVVARSRNIRVIQWHVVNHLSTGKLTSPAGVTAQSVRSANFIERSVVASQNLCSLIHLMALRQKTSTVHE